MEFSGSISIQLYLASDSPKNIREHIQTLKQIDSQFIFKSLWIIYALAGKTKFTNV